MLVAPPNDNGAVTVNAFAETDGLFKDTRTANVIPATYVPLPLWYVTLVIDNAACALIAITKLLVSGPNARFEISSNPFTVVVIVTVGWLGALVWSVIKKSMVAVPLTVLIADPFDEMPDAPPNDNGAWTPSAFADVAGLLIATRTTNVCPATYVPLPLKYVILVIANAACALVAMTSVSVNGPNARPEYSSVPDTVVVIVTDGWLGAPVVSVIRKSMVTDPLIDLVADALAEMPDAPPKDNGAVTANAFAFVAGLFVNATRTTNCCPATYVPLPLVYMMLEICKLACALMLMLNAALGPALNAREVISSVPDTLAVIDNV